MTLQIVSYSNYNVTKVEELIPEPSNCGKRKPVHFEPDKHLKRDFQPSSQMGLDLQSCYLSDVRVINDLVQVSFFRPEDLIYLDLKCNKLQKLDGLEKLANLRILYLHGNEIDDVRELKKLEQLKLDALTVHGNPLVQQTNWKFWVINQFPALRRLDFGGITRRDRSEAEFAQKQGLVTLKAQPNVVWK